MEQPAFNSVIETDLRLSLNEGLDKLVLDAVPAIGFQAPGTDPLLVSIGKAMTTLLAAGYNPDVVVLTPANAEALDTLRATATAGEQYYVFAPAELAPGKLFGLQTRVSKTAAAPFVSDSAALGKLDVSQSRSRGLRLTRAPRTLERAPEGSAVFRVERQATRSASPLPDGEEEIESCAARRATAGARAGESPGASAPGRLGPPSSTPSTAWSAPSASASPTRHPRVGAASHLIEAVSGSPGRSRGLLRTTARGDGGRC